MRPMLRPAVAAASAALLVRRAGPALASRTPDAAVPVSVLECRGALSGATEAF
jgi:hypothetical protein